MIDFSYDESKPMIPNLPTQFFSVVWTGQLLAPTTETYRLSLEV